MDCYPLSLGKDVRFIKRQMLKAENDLKDVDISIYILYNMLDQLIEDERLYVRNREKLFYFDAIQYHMAKDPVKGIIDVDELDKASKILEQMEGVI